jgi:hypothetical protein
MFKFILYIKLHQPEPFDITVKGSKKVIKSRLASYVVGNV